ncbi:MAG: glycoside hydrolase family 3 N-terminal domain-containing protein [Flavobacteriales bacterium]|jgi:beta-N-acetylhexosaminidase
MKNYFLLSFCTVLLLFPACSQVPNASQNTVSSASSGNGAKPNVGANTAGKTSENHYTLSDFLTDNSALDASVNKVFATLDEKQIVAQLLMSAVGRAGLERATIERYVREGLIGNLLMLNGTKAEFTEMINAFNEINKSKGFLPYLYSADAEPSLVNRKITGSKIVKKAVDINSLEEVLGTARSISEDLNDIGINYNFAPVVDVAGNATVGYRGFGSKKEELISWSDAFIQETQKHNIVATAKHFPGHGLVTGDTHTALQTIDGELKEIVNYPTLIKNGVLSVMIGHLAVKNNKKYNTNGLPATCSKTIVTDLLVNEMNFKGLIVTDAMNMGGVLKVPNSTVRSIQAGCHIILMPVDVVKAHSEVLTKYKADPAFKATVDAAAKKVIRMKLCLGLL